MKENNYIVFDFETTGFSPTKNHVIEIAAKKVLKYGKPEMFHVYLKVDYEIPEKITEINGIDNKLLNEKAINREEAWNNFFIFTAGLPLIGHNSISFDKRFLDVAFDKYDLRKPNDDLYIDTAMIYKGKKLNIAQSTNENHFDYCYKIKCIRAKGVFYRLEVALNELNIDVSDLTAHRADSDAEMTDRLYKKMTELKII